MAVSVNNSPHKAGRDKETKDTDAGRNTVNLMGDHSDIEWTEATWNPTTGCDKISPGCTHCYALTMAARLKAIGSQKYQNDGNPKTSGPGFALTLHENTLDMPKRWKKPRTIFVNSMSDLFHPEVPPDFITKVFAVIRGTPQHQYQILTKRSRRLAALALELDWPDNLWMGVSIETGHYRYRIDHLLQTAAKIKFLSCEPLLGSLGTLTLDGIDWVIVGGESGNGARPMAANWVTEIRDQCTKTGTPFFFKQWGGSFAKAGGRQLDGRVWDEMPELSRYPLIEGTTGS